MTKDRLRDVIQAVVEAADEIKRDYTGDDQEYGQLLAYAETLTVIQEACDPEDLETLGLSFDIDKRYL